MIREKYEVRDYVNGDARKRRYPTRATLPDCTNAVCISTGVGAHLIYIDVTGSDRV